MSIKEVFKDSAKIAIKHYWLFLLVALINTSLRFATIGSGNFLKMLLMLALSMFVSYAGLFILLLRTRNEELTKLKMLTFLKSSWRIMHYIIIVIFLAIIALLTVIGLVVFVAPEFYLIVAFAAPVIYFTCRCWFSAIILADTNCKITEAIGESSRITNGNIFKILLFVIFVVISVSLQMPAMKLVNSLPEASSLYKTVSIAVSAISIFFLLPFGSSLHLKYYEALRIDSSKDKSKDHASNKKRSVLHIGFLVVALLALSVGHYRRESLQHKELKETLSYYNSHALEVAMVYDDVYILNRNGNWDKLGLNVVSTDSDELLFTEKYIVYEDMEYNICIYNRKTGKVIEIPEGKYRFPCCFSLINDETELLFCAKVSIENQDQSDTVFAKLDLQSNDHVIKELYRSQKYIHPYFSEDGKVAYFNKGGYVVKLTIDSAVIERITEGDIVGITDDAILVRKYDNYKDYYAKYFLDDGRKVDLWCGNNVYAENIDRQGTCLLIGELDFSKLRFVVRLSLYDIKSGKRYKLPILTVCPSHSIYILKNSEK